MWNSVFKAKHELSNLIIPILQMQNAEPTKESNVNRADCFSRVKRSVPASGSESGLHVTPGVQAFP